jgi:tripartite-type tricarboxylate transporter receptor subunit TctC
LKIRGAGVVLAVLLSAVPGGFVAAQNFPARLVRIVSSAPGNLSDIMARIVAQELTKAWGQPVIVENRANAMIAHEAVAKAVPDGYTLMFVSDSFVGSQFMGDARFRPLEEFSAVSLVALSPSVLVVSSTLPVNSVKALVALAKARPGQLNFGSSTNGSTSHTAMELFNAMAGVKIVRVAYRGNAQAISAVIGGEVQVAMQTVPIATPQIKAGKVKALAVTSPQPSALAPGLPTVAATLPGFEAQSLLGVVAPTGTPGPVVSQIHQDIARAVRGAEVRERIIVT